MMLLHDKKKCIDPFSIYVFIRHYYFYHLRIWGTFCVSVGFSFKFLFERLFVFLTAHA